MRATARTWTAVGISLALGACATLTARTLILTDAEVVKLPHGKHAENDVGCKTCHAKVWKATDLSERLVPLEKTCLKCHAEWKEEEPAKCEACHVAMPPRSFEKREQHLVFNHQAHLGRVKDEDCTTCHKELPEPGVVKSFVPSMATCFGCHNHQDDWNQGKCGLCHQDLTRVPLRPVAGFSHQGDFLKQHPSQARTASATCAQCHTEEFCLDCHTQTSPAPVEVRLAERPDRSFIHRNDWVSRHQVEGANDRAMCLRCHGVSSCETCHTKSGLSSAAANGRNPHPPGWAQPAGAKFHGAEARRDIVSCAACHDQGASSNCIGCHKVGGVGGNPHPPSFLSKRGSESKSGPACAPCH